MKKLFFFVAFVAMSMLSVAQVNQLVWANGRLLYGTPIESIDSLTYDEMQDVDTLHLLLPRTLIKVVHDTVYIHDTVYVETDCGGEDDTPSAGIGVFSVSADKQVTFSKGNLQYTQSTNTWSFAENQYDYLGEANIAIDANVLADKVDLFGWSTSSTKFGVSTSMSNNDYSGSFVDWGTNQIGNDVPNTWRTLTDEEWDYLRNGRPNASSLRGVAQVSGVNGLILLPDTWICPEGITFKSGFHGWDGIDYYAEYQTFTAEQWSKMESTGAIFLPAAGHRDGSYVRSVQYSGYYWSATEIDSDCGGGFYFFSIGAGMNSLIRYGGRSVRLVQDIEGENIDPEQPGEGGEDPVEPNPNTGNHEYVDLGLSVKWATCNVGATKPEEYGDYFAWGETEPKDYYYWSTYKHCNGSSSTLTKYNNNSSYGTVDNKTQLELSDDAAAVNWGGSWRMPTHEEQEELRTQCTWIWTTQNGVNGYKVTSKKNGNSIFLPAAGYRYASSLDGAGSYGNYWASSLSTGYPSFAYYLYFYSDGAGWYDDYRYLGFTVRPVCQ